MSTIKISQLTPATLPLAGTEVLPIVQANETRKASIAALSSFANVKAYGAIGDGVTDDTAAIQSCVNANDGVFFPAGTYKVSSAVNLRANNTVFGEGASSIILYTGTAASRGAFFVDSGSPTAYVDNITIRDLKLLGQVATLGFNQFIHLISLSGVRNCLIERCVVEGFRGDGIFIGSGMNEPFPDQTERHNINVTIRDCYIDGVNKDNRNGISVIDCDGMNIDNNYITRTTRSTMPGAIDIEPDSNAFHVIRDISIRNNKIVDCGGNVAAIGVFLPYVAYTTWPTGFNIENNFVDTPSAPTDNLYGIFFQYGSPFTSPPNPVVTDGQNDFSIRVANNVVRFPAIGPGRGFVMWNCNNVVMTDNTFSGGSTSYIGYVNANVVDFTLANNQFTYVNGSGDYAVTVFSAQRLNILNNVFKDCGGVSGAARGAILFVAGNRITNSDFATDTDWTKGTGWSIAAGVATKTAGTGSNLSQPVVIAENGTYQLTYTITRSAGSITPRLVGSTTVTGTARSASGTYTETLTAPAGSVTFELVADASFAGTVDNVYLWSGSSSYVRINGNTFTSPNGTYTQQAVTYDSHTFDRATNTFLNNAVLAGTNAFEALQYDNTNGVGFNSLPAATTRINVGGALPSSGTVSLPVVVDGAIPSSTTATGVMYRTAPTTAAASFTLSNLQHFQATQGTLGAGSAVTNQFGFVADSSLTGGTNNFGFYGAIASGANRYNFYAAGTAPNYFAGNTGINQIPSAWNANSTALQVSSHLSVGTDNTNRPIITNNSYVDSGGSYRYINSAVSSRFRMNPTDSRMDWGFAPSGNAGDAFSYTNHLALYSDGRMALVPGVATDAWAKFRVGGTLPTSSNQSVASDARYTIPSGTTTLALGYQSAASTEAASFTVATLKHFAAEQATIGAGSAITTQMGFSVDNSITGATNNYGFHGAIDAGSNRFNCYMVGTARNYFAGGVEVVAGTTTMASGFTHIPAAAGAPTGAPTNPSGNVPMYYDSTNNKIYVYSGGTWRSTAALT